MNAIETCVKLAEQEEQLAGEQTEIDQARQHLRAMKAYDKAAYQLSGIAIQRVTANLFMVPSRTKADVYRVNLSTGSCTCDAGQSGQMCWHRAAAEALAQSDELAPGDAPVRTPARRTSAELLGRDDGEGLPF